RRPGRGFGFAPICTHSAARLGWIPCAASARHFISVQPVTPARTSGVTRLSVSSTLESPHVPATGEHMVFFKRLMDVFTLGSKRPALRLATYYAGLALVIGGLMYAV